MKQQIHLFTFGIAFLGVVNAASATCPEGTERPCIINGKPGTRTCGHLGWGPCVPIEEGSSPTPTPGTVECCPSIDVGPTTLNFSLPLDLDQSVSGRILSLAVSADPAPGCYNPDGCTVVRHPGSPMARLYAGTYAGVWRSDDEGRTWRQLTRPQPTQGQTNVPRALLVPNVYSVAVSPTNRDIVLAATAGDTRNVPQNGIYRSTDGGNTWSLHRFQCSDGGPVGQIVFAPDSGNVVYAAAGCAVAISTDAGATWREKRVVDAASGVAGSIWHVAVTARITVAIPPGTPTPTPVPQGLRYVYGVGEGQAWFSPDGGENWYKDLGCLPPATGPGASFPFGGQPSDVTGSSDQVLAVEPGNFYHVYLAVPYLANGPSYYHQGDPNLRNLCDGVACNTQGRGCEEGSIWAGDYSRFTITDPARRMAQWSQLPGPPAFWGGSTPSGNVYVVAKKTSTGFLLFFADRSHVHISSGSPTTSASWHRLDGRDASQSELDGDLTNKRFVHVDPHALAASIDFDISLKLPTNLSCPYNQNSVFDQYRGGTLWMANDGGVYRSIDGGHSWVLGRGLATLAAGHIAGLAAPGRAPALYINTGDNDNFFSLDGGTSWRGAGSGCGDCGPWFADPAQAFRVLSFSHRVGDQSLFDLYRNPSGDYPNPRGSGSPVSVPCPPGDCDTLKLAERGYTPIVLTLAGENPPQDGDYVLIRLLPQGSFLTRTTQISSIRTPDQWQDRSLASVPGGFLFLPLPNYPTCRAPSPQTCVNAVQIGGGHARPVFYVSDPDHTKNLWKWTEGITENGRPSFKLIVPGGPPNRPDLQAQIARRFFVDPYDANVVYIIDQDSIKRSDDGGETWRLDLSLDNISTENHMFAYAGDGGVIKDMIFDRQERGTRFAVGNAGVFYTLDGTNWQRILSTTALPGHPVAAYFDSISDARSRALYVAMKGRSILRLSPVPQPVLPCAAERARLNALENELRTLEQSGGPSDVKERLIQDWHEQHDAEVSQLRTRLASPECTR